LQSFTCLSLHCAQKLLHDTVHAFFSCAGDPVSIAPIVDPERVHAYFHLEIK